MTNGDQKFEIPAEMRTMAERSVEQARQAFDGFFSATERALTSLHGQTNSVQSSAKSMTSQAVNFAERNVQASLDYAQRLTQAKDAAEMMKVHGDYVATQMKAFSEQAQSMGEEVKNAADRAKHRE